MTHYTQWSGVHRVSGWCWEHYSLMILPFQGVRPEQRAYLGFLVLLEMGWTNERVNLLLGGLVRLHMRSYHWLSSRQRNEAEFHQVLQISYCKSQTSSKEQIRILESKLTLHKQTCTPQTVLNAVSVTQNGLPSWYARYTVFSISVKRRV